MTSTRFAAAFLALAILASTASTAEVRGIVNKVDAEKKELVIETLGLKNRRQQLTLVVNPETPVTLGRQPGKLGDLTPGQRVRVSFETRNGRNVASSISSLNLLPVVTELANPKGAPVAAADGNTVAGELRRVARTDRELVVLDPKTKAETVLAVPENLAVTKQGKPVPFEELQEGEHALVRYETRDGKRLATAVQVGEGVVAAPQENRIQRIRQILKMVDMALDLAERNKMFDR